MTMPEPMCTNAKWSTSRPWPRARSASAAASTSFSITSEGPNASRSPARAAGRSQPRSPPVSFIALRRGSYTPGLPITVWVIAGRRTLTLSHSRSASPTSSATRPRTLVACARIDCLARISPDRSAIAPRTYSCPMSRPSTRPAFGLISYSRADRPGTPVRWPAMRTSPARSTLSRASETVGLDRPDTRASSAREQGPRWRMCSSRSCSFIARISEGLAANRIAPEFSGGGNAEADPRVSARSGGGEAKAGSAVPVTATSSVGAARGGPGGMPGHPDAESYDLRHPEVKTLRQFARDLVPDR